MKKEIVEVISVDTAKRLIGVERIQRLIKRGSVKYARQGRYDSDSYILIDSLPWKERIKFEESRALIEVPTINQHPHNNMRSHNNQAVFVRVQHSPQEALKMRLESLCDLLQEVELFYRSDRSHLSAHSSLPAESNLIGNLTHFLEAQEHAISYFLSKHTSFEHPAVRKLRDKL